MTKIEKKKLINTNAAIWAAGILISFVLPFVAESLSDGPALFLQVLTHVFPLTIAMWASTNMISKAVGEPSG